MDLAQARVEAARLFPKLDRSPKYCPLTELGRREVETQGISFGAHFGKMTPSGFPLPGLLYYGLTELLRLEDLGTDEKVAWTVPFEVDGSTYAFSMRKFGLRFLVEPRNLDAPLTREVLGKARALTDIVEAYLSTSFATQQIAAGKFSIENLYDKLDERYRVLRRQAIQSYETPPPPEKTSTDEYGHVYTAYYYHIPQVEGGAFATAAVDAYFSRLEHLFCLAAAFEPARLKSEDFRAFLAASWPTKMKTLLDLGSNREVKRFYDQLVAIREEWRNPIAHGGFLSGGHSLYFHLPGVGALPARMRRTPEGVTVGFQLPHSSFKELIELFDSFDAFLAKGPFRCQVRWAESYMAVSFDPTTRKAYVDAMRSDEAFGEFIDGCAQAEDRATNMDW